MRIIFPWNNPIAPKTWLFSETPFSHGQVPYLQVLDKYFVGLSALGSFVLSQSQTTLFGSYYSNPNSGMCRVP